VRLPRRFPRLLAGGVVFAAALAVAACGDSGSPITANTEVISSIPWSPPETARYRIRSDHDVVGSGELKIEEQAGALVLSQRFHAEKDNIADDASATVEKDTLRPQAVSRVISGPKGDRRCEAKYEGSSVKVEQSSSEGQRTDQLDLPGRAYDTWGDLFLWRTLDFSEGLHATYSAVLTCTLVKPEVIRVSLDVKKLEAVEAPAGKFQAWRLEIRSGGETTKAWYADDAARTLVRYDNGQQVFELESVD
jgi:hypothetical protein